MIYAFQNVEQFKELFGKRETANGEQVRMNKILLNFLRDKSAHNYIRDNYPDAAHWYFTLSDIPSMYARCFQLLEKETRNVQLNTGGVRFWLNNMKFASNDYRLDEYDGLCTDGDYKAVRYVRIDNGRVYKMKAGKFFKSCVLNTPFGQHLGESTLLSLCEEFARRWEAYAQPRVGDEHITLVVDDDFEAIYSSDNYKEGSFGSCMTDEDQHYFYNNAIDARAASIRDADDKILARCVVYTNVKETGSDKVWRLAERQYSMGGEEVLKRRLVDELIRGGYIDGYKSVGASCHDNALFVDNEGNSLRNNDFYITCDLYAGDTLSYQDSFIYYDYNKHIAYNHSCHHYSNLLDTTSGDFEGGEWDSYHGRYVEEVVTVYYHGREETCDSEDLDDFIDVNGDFHYEEDVVSCDECGEYVLEEDAYYSDITEEYYCCESCREDAERDYKERNWYYAEIDDDYYEDEDEISVVHVWNTICQEYQEKTISNDLLAIRLDDGMYFEHDGEYYNTLDHIVAA